MRALALGLSLLSLAVWADDGASADAVYEQGKAAYDAKRYDEALRHFDEAARLEPTKARWQYNRGLALRKLKRSDEARLALMESLRLDPNYKRSEIDQKLTELGDGASDGEGESYGSRIAVLLAFGGLYVLYLLWGVVRDARGGGKKSTRSEERAPPVVASTHRQTIPPVLQATGARLGRCEHALSLGDDEEARTLLDQAYSRFVQLRGFLRRDAVGEREVQAVQSGLVQATDAAEERLRARHGAAFDTAIGPRRGCFFCARPLPNDACVQAVQLKRGDEHITVEACRLCARRAGTNSPPKALFVRAPGGETHWANVARVDPYEFAYSDHTGNSREASPGELTRPDLDLNHLATMAGLTGAAVIAARAMDLDALAEAEAASAAATAAARSASSRRNESRWNDAS